MPRTCFILDELYPAERGGIGRLMHNIIHHAKQSAPDLDLHILLARRKPAGISELEQAFNGVAALHYFAPDDEIAGRLGVDDLNNAVAANPNLKAPALNGMRVLDTLLQAQIEVGDFDHIEIPDHMGLGASVLAARAAGIAFENAQITCRIHSALSVIIGFEPFHHARSDWLAPRLEAERYSLQNADRVVAHIPAIADYNQQHFGFDAAWRKKVEIAFPPVLWPATDEVDSALPETPDFIFTSRFQPFKRPELFIKAAVTLLDRNTDYKGSFRLISYGFDRDYVDDLRMLVPKRHFKRIRFMLNTPEAERQAAMAGGIIVQPSAFESLCALAYEVAGKANPILLSRDCIAFGGFSRWVEGENCLMFDATPKALADTMQQALEWQPSGPVDVTADPAYFAAPSLLLMRTKQEAQKTCLMIGPLKNRADFDLFHRFCESRSADGVSMFGYADERYRAVEDEKSDILWLGADGYQGAQLKAHTKGYDLTILADINALPDVDFIKAGQNTVKAGRAFSANSISGEPGRLNIYPGKMPSLLASDYRICPACVMLHRDDLDLIGTNDDRDLIARALVRLAGSDVDLVMSPLGMIREDVPLVDARPDRRLLGYETPPYWQGGVRKIAVDVKSARHSTLLHQRLGGVTPEGVDSDFALTINIDSDTPKVVPLDPDESFSGEILTIRAHNQPGGGVVSLSLHQSNEDAAIKAHSNGLMHRLYGPNQKYTSRWGPVWRDGPVMLVVSSAKPGRVVLDQFTLLARE